ncbi:DUF1109 domain-containing protein [Brevundimonas sp.]|uniref:DUF1109 domain-containing protein n=1 Tax=Brevundimonas sp. TaxID=1871086 RepID=UPI0025D013D4|nr:DUF1109 domain-containing protein [Brevundimonas sp.]
MKTDDLIEALALGVEPVRPARLDPLTLAAAVAASVLTVVLVLRLRPDLVEALGDPMVWVKGVYTAGLAGAGLWLATRLGTPGREGKAPALLLTAIAGLMLGLGLFELILTPADERGAVLLGETWRVCGRNILIASVLTGPLVFVSARRLAPTRPVLSGLALGAAASAIGATAYGVLHCPEATLSFLAVWYTSAIALGGLVGGVAGRLALRW